MQPINLSNDVTPSHKCFGHCPTFMGPLLVGKIAVVLGKLLTTYNSKRADSSVVVTIHPSSKTSIQSRKHHKAFKKEWGLP